MRSWVSCAADPRRRGAQVRAEDPGDRCGSAASAVALGLAERIGRLNLTEGAPGPVRVLRGDRFVGEANPEGVKNTLDLMTSGGRDAALEAARKLGEAGAGALVLACTGGPRYHRHGRSASLPPGDPRGGSGRRRGSHHVVCGQGVAPEPSSPETEVRERRSRAGYPQGAAVGRRCSGVGTTQFPR